MSNKSGICPKCQKPKTKAGGSSITQWISVCVCDSLEALDQAAVQQAAEQELQICSICSKRINPGRQGSFTQYIFRSDLCGCAQPRPRNATEAERLTQSAYVPPDIEPELGDEEVQEELPLDETNFPIERYKPLFVLGAGSTGTVYLCRDKLLSKRVAVKKLNAVSAEQLVAFQLEAKATSKLNHPNIVTVLDFGVLEDSSIPFMVMEYVKGTSLLKYLIDQGTIDVEKAIDIVCDLCDALIYAHEHSTFHRDVKPSNIILDFRSDGSLDVRLIDFGVATVTSQTLTPGGFGAGGIAGINSDVALVGTPTYMSPDSISGLPYDQRSELYSIGCTLFEMLTGRPPFEATGSLEVVSMHANEQPPTLDEAYRSYRAGIESGSLTEPEIADRVFPEELEAIVARCLAKDPDDRFQTLASFRTALSELKESLNPLPEPESSNKQVASLENRKRVLFLSLLSISIVFGITSLVYWVTLSKKSQETQKIRKLPPNIIVDVLTPDYKEASFEEGFCRLEGRWKKKDLEELANQHPDEEEIRASSNVVADWAALGSFKKLKRLSLTTSMIKDQQLDAVVTAVPDMVDFEINNTLVSDDGFKSIAKWKSLQQIEFCETLVGNRGLKYISELKNLHRLECAKSRVTDDGLRHLAKVPLSLLSLSSCVITDLGAGYIAAIPTVNVIRLNTTEITDESLEILGKLPDLQELEICHCPKISDVGMKAIAKYPRLNRLMISETSVSSGGLEALVNCPMLRTLSASSLNLTDKDLAPLLKMQLTELTLNGNPITDKGLASFARKPQLNQLVLCKCDGITADGVKTFESEFQKLNGRKIAITTTTRKQLSSEDSEEFGFLLGDSDVEFGNKSAGKAKQPAAVP